MSRFKRTPQELQTHARFWWPEKLLDKAKEVSGLEVLLESHETFISLLHVASSSADAWKGAINLAADMPANLFLKHLMVISDVGSEQIKRIAGHASRIFPDGTMTFQFRGSTLNYRFQALKARSAITDRRLGVDGPSLGTSIPLSALIEDVTMLILHGGDSKNDLPPQLKRRCILGRLLGNKSAIAELVRRRYLEVSRIVCGAIANALGHLASRDVIGHLQRQLPEWEFSTSGKIPGISQTADKNLTSFDIVAKSPCGCCTAIEVSFQETTNSTYERKKGQVADRISQIHRMGHFVAYVLDGAGNFEREAALRALCAHSDCTVAMTPSELDVLCDFLRSVEKSGGARVARKHGARK